MRIFAMTITEIAELAGVSIGTVDRVIHKRGRVSAKTVAKVEKIIKSSGFTPNPIARQLALKKDFVVGILLPLKTDDAGYWELIFDGIEKACEELKPFSIKLAVKNFDRKKSGDFTAKAEALSKIKIDALITAPVIAEEASKALKFFSDIPYVFVDSSLPEGKQLTTVAQNPYASGVCAARLMKLIVPDAEKIVCVQMYPDSYNLKERARGFTEFFKEKNVINVAGNCNTKNETDSFIKSIIAKKPDGIFVSNNASFSFVEYCRAHNIKKKFALIGYDLMKQNKKFLAEDFIDCIISQQPEQQGYEAVKAIYRHSLINEKVNKTMKIPITIYFKENI